MMPRPAHPLTILLVVLLQALLCLAPGAQAQDGVATDKAALTALYNATEGANWTTNTNWTSDMALSSWHGVTTNSDGRVTALVLNDNGLDGTLPASLGNLSELEQLDLRDNDLSGALPTELADLTHLTSLLLNESRALTGSLPDGLRELTDLTTVRIRHTELCAPDNDDFQTWWGTLSSKSGLICPPTEQSVIEVAVFYTPAARSQGNGTAGIKAKIDLMVAATNTAYTHSAVNQRIKAVAVEEVAYTEVDSETDLARLHDPGDGYMDEVHDIRDRFGADIVMLIRRGILGDVSRAYLMTQVSLDHSSFAFGVVASAGGALHFAHELGHIMGLNHDRFVSCESGICEAAAFPYAYGYVNQPGLRPGAPASKRWFTIMAYNDECKLVACRGLMRFSDPEQTYQDDPMGIAGLAPSNSRTNGPSDAVRALNRARGYVANFRQLPPDITVSFGAEEYEATEDGTVANVTLELSAVPTRPIDIPLTLTATGATAYDYTGVPATVDFDADDTEQTFTVRARDDAADDDGETVTLTLGEPLPAGVTGGSPSETTVTLTDNDPDPGVPSILTVELTSDPGSDDLYTIDDKIEVSVRFSKTVTVTGEPQLTLTMGTETQDAKYRDSAGEVVRFVYTVAEGDRAADGVSIATDSLSDDGTIRDSENRDAVRTHDEVAADANHGVDGTRPVLQSAEVNLTDLTLTYDKALDETSVPSTTAFRVRVGGATFNVTSVVVRGGKVTLTLSRSVQYGEDALVSYTAGSGLRDLLGNPVASLSDHPVTNIAVEYDSDSDRDGLLAITNVVQLDAMRYDLDGDGTPSPSGKKAYNAAFPDFDSPVRCVLARCTGYELSADLDFDTNRNGMADTGDTYWNNGAGWNPIGHFSTDGFEATFEGNGHKIANLFINRTVVNNSALTKNALFAGTQSSSTIRNVGLVNVDVTVTASGAGTRRAHSASALVGTNGGTIRACYATGRVEGLAAGGLVANNLGTIRASYAAVRVRSGDDNSAGGLAMANSGTIRDSYATGPVGSDGSSSGLATVNTRTIRDSYATGLVWGGDDPLPPSGGLVGANYGSGTITTSYWDTSTSGQTTSAGGASGQTTTALQAPTGATGIYSTWDTDQWDFGTASQYPVLKADFDGDGTASWQEFGRQLREGPILTVTPGQVQVGLTWTAVTASHWTPAPSVTYILTRGDSTTVATLGEGLSGLTFTDTNVTAGVTYTYQVAAVVQGGEATRSALATTATLPNMWLTPTAADPVASVRSEATYTVTFQGAWNTTVTTGGVPSGAHFTTLIGGVHNASVTFLMEGGMASAGVESMAELGGTSTLAAELNAADPNALSVLQGSDGNIGPTGASTINMVTLTTDHPRITLLSMVAPSPDWFVGVSGLSLLDAQGDWLPSRTVNLYPWDAGTEEGTEFSLTNSATSPQGTITSLRGIGKFSNERIATLTFTRQSVNTAPSFSSGTSFEADENQAAAGRVVAADPDRGDGVTYAITGGADASKFDIGETTGVLTFKVPPNHERAADAASTNPINGAGNNEYVVTVMATGGTGDRAMTSEKTITVTVRNVEEAGTISFSQGGMAITAVLSDPDGGVSSATWQWARSSNRNTGWRNIGSATSAGYTPSDDDQGMYLRATVSYNDAQGSLKHAQGLSASQIAPPDLRVATLVSGLSIPWDFAFTPDGTMLFTQRRGVLSSRLADGTVQTIDADFGDLFARGETGLMGIVVDPRFASNRRFYTCQGHTGPEIQVIAWSIDAAYTQATRVADPLIGGLPATSGRHGGCRLRFGPEGYLWIATGDAASGTVPQDLASLGGKVLRVDASTGAGAPTNPFAPSRVYTYGHRNVQGLALRPGTSQMWSVEHGPSVDDEINRLVAGRNYGWDPVPGYNESVAMTDLAKYPEAVEAKWSSGSPTLATSGGIFLDGEQWGVWEGRLAVAALKDRKLRLFEFTPDGAFVSQVIVSELDGAFGRLRTPMMGPDGALYVSTSNGGGSDRILRIAEDDPIPVTLKLTPSVIGENGGVSTVTASQDRVSIAATTVTVSAMAVNPAVPGDFILSTNRTLTIPAGQTDSTGTVTVQAVDNTADAPNKEVRVSATADNIEGIVGPDAVTLTINDDDAAPAVTLKLTPSSITENGGMSTVTATLNRASIAATAVTVSATAVRPAVPEDFTLSANRTLTIPAGQTDSTGTVTVRAVDNTVDAPNKEVRVSATADNSQGIAGNPPAVTLRITDDDTAPELTLTLRPSVIVEDGGISRVTAEIVNRVTFAEDQEIALTFAGTAVKGTDYTVGLERLTLIAGQSSTATTLTAVQDRVDDDAETIRVMASHGGGTIGAAQTITIIDDDAAPLITTASLILVAENETAVATITATDADRPAEDLTWRITGGADRNRFTLTGDGALAFRAAQDYEAPGDSDGNGDYEVTVQVSDGFNPVDAVLTVRLEDVDDTAPVLSSASVNGATLTLTYGEALDPNSRPGAGDFTVSGGDSARTVSNVAVSGRAVTLTLNPAVGHGETGIRVSYRPGTSPIQDAAGNDAARLSNAPVTNNTGDTTAPAVSTIAITSRPERDATYAAGKDIEVTVTFSETVVVTGTPRLRLKVGGVNRTAAYRSGTGAAALFVYMVAEGESDTDGVSIDANSLTLNGGRIRDGANNNALLTHDALAPDAGHQVDGVKPALAANGGAVVNGATLVLTYGEALNGGSTPLTAAFTVNVEGTERSVSGVAVMGSAVTLALDPEVGVGREVRITYRVPGANPIQDIAGNAAAPLTNRQVENNTRDTTAPAVSRVAVTSDPGPDGTYAEEDILEVTVTFSETVRVDTTNGTPSMTLRVGRRSKPAHSIPGPASAALRFTYTVEGDDIDTDGVSLAAGRIVLNGGTIADLADNPALLAYEAVPPQPGHAVDGVRPELRGASVNGATLTLTYGEALDGNSTPATDDFTVRVADTERLLTQVLVSGRAVQLTLDSPVTPGETVTVSYTAGTDPIRDATGNAAEDLTEYTAATPGPVDSPGPGPGPGPGPRPTTPSEADGQHGSGDHDAGAIRGHRESNTGGPDRGHRFGPGRRDPELCDCRGCRWRPVLHRRAYRSAQLPGAAELRGARRCREHRSAQCGRGQRIHRGGARGQWTALAGPDRGTGLRRAGD